MIETKQVYIQQEQNNGTAEQSIATSGTRALVYAMATILEVLQRFSIGMLDLSATEAKLNQEASKEWLEVMTLGKDSDQAKIAKEAASGDKPEVKSAIMTKLNAMFQLHQTAAQQERSWLTSLTGSAQKVGDDTAQAMNIGSDSAQAMIDAWKRIQV